MQAQGAAPSGLFRVGTSPQPDSLFPPACPFWKICAMWLILHSFWKDAASLFASQAIPPSAQPAATKSDRAIEGWSGKV